MQHVSEAEPGARPRSRFCLRGLGGDCRSRPPASKHEAAVSHAEAFRRAPITPTERDALADELRERYPAIASELAGLLARIRANNEGAEGCQPERRAWIDPSRRLREGCAQWDQLSDHLGEAAAARS
jgi:hypothetical protein